MIASVVIWRGEHIVRYERTLPNFAAFGFILAVLLLVTGGLLGFSDAFVRSWLPLTGESEIPAIGWPVAVLATFLLDIGVVTYLVARTGGSRDSPYQPAFFLLPTLAIFLREPLTRVLLYVVAIGAAFSVLLMQRYELHLPEGDRYRLRGAYWLVTMCSLGLATYIGFRTRGIG